MNKKIARLWVPSHRKTGELKEVSLVLESASDNMIASLVDAGFDTFEKIAEAGREELVALKYIGDASADKILAEVTGV
jgi:hypothetical protein